MEGTDPISMRTLQPGTRLGRYRVVQRIGVGGMAEIYLAIADGISRFAKLVVLKLVHAHMAADKKLGGMLLKEARIAATLDHPNIAQVIDVGTENGEHYLAMEYVHGKDVGAILRALPRGEPMPLACALEIVHSACDGLHYAHTKADLSGRPLGIVHRDVTPSNVLVSHDGVVKLVDFGIAKVGGHASTTQTGVLKGKFGYMSPEQSTGAPIDHRSDVFALGILLYELLVARRAFVGHNAFAVMNRVIAGDFVHPCAARPDLAPELGAIVVRAMAVDRDERFPTAAAMREAIADFAHERRIRLGAPVLADLMRTHFGTPEVPVVTGLPDVKRGGDAIASATVTTERVDGPTTRARRRRRQWTTVAGLASVALVAGLVGWRVGADDREQRAREVVEAPVVPAAIVAPTPVAVTPVVASPPVVERAAAKTAEVPPTKRASKATGRGKRKAEPAPAPDPAKRLDSMLPPSMQP